MITQEEFYKACAIVIEFTAQSMKLHNKPVEIDPNKLIRLSSLDISLRLYDGLTQGILHDRKEPWSHIGASIITLGDVCTYSSKAIMRFMNIGKLSLDELANLLNSKGLKLNTN